MQSKKNHMIKMSLLAGFLLMIFALTMIYIIRPAVLNNDYRRAGNYIPITSYDIEGYDDYFMTDKIWSEELIEKLSNAEAMQPSKQRSRFLNSLYHAIEDDLITVEEYSELSHTYTKLEIINNHTVIKRQLKDILDKEHPLETVGIKHELASL